MNLLSKRLAHFHPMRVLPSPATNYGISRSFSSEKKVTNEQFCRDKVKQQDYEGFLIGLLFPKQFQSAYFALKAFNVEIATVRDQIPKNTNNIARLRFQFWRDVLHEIQETKKVSTHINQPVALELLDAIQKHNLTVRWFERMLEAR
jgi:NADH dehydrogenase [ubiquinone] 1 alpha subcomplex assembly factor 6